ncbi:MAG: hypothetical protein RI964_812 [Pseudomonadota bacterium]|jgi:hypothetical protein
MKYQVKDTPISVKPGVIAKPGDVIELKESDAQELVDAGLIEVVKEVK